MRSLPRRPAITPLRKLLCSWALEASSAGAINSSRQRRNASTSARKGEGDVVSDKIMLRPFAITPEVAKAAMNEEVYNATGHPIHAAIKLFARLMFAGEKSTSYLEKVTNAYPRLGQVELVNFKAVYWPIWRFTYIAEYTLVKKAFSTSGIISLDVYFIPGNHHSPLSALDFRRHLISAPVPVPLHLNPSSHTKPLNPISARTDLSEPTIKPKIIPFSISSFDVLAMGRGMVPGIWRDTSRFEGDGWKTVDFGVRVDRDVKETLIAAYPLYQPLYIAEYDLKMSSNPDDPVRRIPLVMDASDRVVKTIFRPNRYPSLGSKWNDEGAHFYWENRKYINTNIASIAGPIIHQNEEEYISTFLNPSIGPSDCQHHIQSVMSTVIPPESPLAKLQRNEKAIPWGDVRIQRYGGKEYEENVRWRQLRLERFARNRDLSRVMRGEEPVALDADWRLADHPNPVEGAREMCREANRLWEKHRPSWMQKAGSKGTGKITPDPSGRFVKNRW